MSYAFASGKIRVLEKRLLDAIDLERMADAPTPQEAFKVLADTDVAENLGDFGLENYQQALDNSLLQTKKILEKITPQLNLFKILYLKYDFHNIKLLFELKHLGLDQSAAEFSNLGAEKLEGLKDLIINGKKKTSIAPELEKAIIDLDEKISEEKSPSYIDLACDLAYFELLKKLAKKLANPFISRWTSWQVDISNLRIFLRTRALKKDKEFLNKNLISGGQIALPELAALFVRLTANSQADEIFVHFIKKHFPPSMQKQLTDYIAHPELWRLEHGLDNLALHYLRQAKYITYGPELIVAYHYAKENSVKNIRLIMTGKINNVPGEEIKERARNVF